MFALGQFNSSGGQGRTDADSTYADAFRVGQGLARAGTAPMAFDSTQQTGPGQGGALGDVSHLTAQLAATSPSQRSVVIARAQQTNEQLAHVLMGLKGYPLNQRLAIAQHLAQTTGLIDPGAIGAGDVTDQGIDAHLAQAMAVEQFLKREGGYSPPQASPLPIPAAGSEGKVGPPSIETRPDPRTLPTGAGHLTNAQLSTALGL